MESLWIFLDKLQDYMKMVAAFFVVGMAAVTCSDVGLRVMFNSPIFGSEEIVSICSLLVMGFALPYSHKKNAHIGVKMLMRLFSKKTQSVVKVATNTLAVLLMSVISWRMVIFAGSMAKSGERSMNLQLPMYYFAYILGGGFIVFTIFILKDVIMFFKGVEER